MKYIILFPFLISLYSAQNYYENGNKLYKEKKYDKAIELFTLAINTEDHVSDAYMLRGNCKAIINEEGAMSDLIISKELNPNNYLVYFYIGSEYLINGDVINAKENLEKSISINNKYALAVDFLCIALMASDNLQEALKLSETAVRLDPNGEDFYLHRGVIKMKLGMLGDAIKDLEKDLGKGSDVNIYSNLAVCYYQMKDYDNTINFATKALVIEPKLLDVLLFRASSYDKTGQTKLACNDFQNAKGLGANLSDEKINKICE